MIKRINYLRDNIHIDKDDCDLDVEKFKSVRLFKILRDLSSNRRSQKELVVSKNGLSSNATQIKFTVTNTICRLMTLRRAVSEIGAVVVSRDGFAIGDQ